MTAIALLIIEDIKASVPLELSQRAVIDRELSVDYVVRLLELTGGNGEMVRSVLMARLSPTVRACRETTNMRIEMLAGGGLYQPRGTIRLTLAKRDDGSLREEEVTPEERRRLDSALAELMERQRWDERHMRYEGGYWRYEFSPGRFVTLLPEAVQYALVERVMHNGELMYRITRRAAPAIIGGVLAFGQAIEGELIDAATMLERGVYDVQGALRVILEQQFSETYLLIEETRIMLQHVIRELAQSLFAVMGVDSMRGMDITQSQLGVLSPMIVSPEAMVAANLPDLGAMIA